MIAVFVLISLVLLIIFAVFTVRFVTTMLRSLRTGLVEGPIFGSRRYSRAKDPLIFWANICGSLVGAAFVAIALLWALLIVGSIISAYFGQPTL